MKIFLKGIIAIAIVTILASFTFLPGSPSDVAVSFEKAMLVLNFDSAKQYISSNSFDLFSQTEEATKNSLLPDSIKQILAQATVKSIGETKIDDSTTRVTVSVVLSKPIIDQQETKDSWILKKENDTWKVDLVATMQGGQDTTSLAVPSDDSTATPSEK